MTKEDIWRFSGEDLELAIMGLAYPRKKEKPERVQVLHNMIMEKFEQDVVAFREWSAKIHDEIIETLPEAVEEQQHSLVKIVKWELGKYFRV